MNNFASIELNSVWTLEGESITQPGDYHLIVNIADGEMYGIPFSDNDEADDLKDANIQFQFIYLGYVTCK